MKSLVGRRNRNKVSFLNRGASASQSLGTGQIPDNSEGSITGLEDSDVLTALTTVVDPQHEGQHPELATVCVMDCQKQTRIVPNSDQAYELTNECFEGHVMLLMRTPDVDAHNNNNPKDTACSQNININNSMGPTQRAVSDYFKGKKRRFEFQFQIKLKRIPEGALFLGCELEEPIKVSGLTKGLVGLLLAMVRRINPGFHYSWGTTHHHPHHPTSNNNNSEQQQQQTADFENGNYEKTHLSFPVEASMDRIVISKPGETPPVLGQELHETPESVRRRRKQGAGCVDWNLEDTYTMCLWSAYCDWITWRSSNVPGVSPFSLSRVTGQQPIYLSVYEIVSCPASEYKRKRPPHWQSSIHAYTRLEFSHAERVVGGLAERVLGRGKRQTSMIATSEHSLPDTESDVGSEVETLSRVSHITN